MIGDPVLRKAFGSAGSLESREVAFGNGDAVHRVVRLSSSALVDKAGRNFARLWMLHDLTDQRAAEAERKRLAPPSWRGYARVVARLRTSPESRS